MASCAAPVVVFAEFTLCQVCFAKDKASFTSSRPTHLWFRNHFCPAPHTPQNQTSDDVRLAALPKMRAHVLSFSEQAWACR